MRVIFVLLVAFAGESALACKGSLLDQDFRRLASSDTVNLCEAYDGKVVLVVNTASKCGNTPQYDGLEKLYQEYGEQGLVVLGFPSNDFLGQEPGTEDVIKNFCRLTYGVKFPMFEKTTVRGENPHPFFAALAESAGNFPKWNFHKYLIGRDGQFIAQFSPQTSPSDNSIITALETALNE